ncbi:uncharacterized protein K460DRAFT_393128 [Cucurbitaria berberidis CBS 394.84]|uniref:N-acetyltransferase domain-containing protein n=1 Tax=Cucurbitaria berberidis CBS 394.84 TaxID=1168544 RepID=A0A9P4LAC1_9PLEO|nr:uncharacterized protein K460DRAFT_393128 [Cucurbitaria berberidis CBS 394.84]KAF1847910.1 hypothetical protein K460DRAFT_393128 [Cucurbitaria berberidis CBS 394.84]
MPLTVSLVTDSSDFDQIIPMDYDAWRTPYNPQLKHFRPPFPTREESLAHAKEKATKKFEEHDPDYFMVKVTDTATSEIIGWATWAINDPQKSTGEKTVAHWHAEGSEEREFAEMFINGLWGFIAERVTRKHMDLLSIVVHPSHRHRGAGRLLIRWGTAKADELGIETVISSLASARGAYEKCGLGCIEIIPPDPELQRSLENLEKAGRGQKWKELLEDDLSGWLMWRPIGRDWREGDRAPWCE